MQHDTSGISYEQLIQLINLEYDLGIVSVVFLPRGEEAFAYLATGADGRRHFVRMQESARTADLGIALRVAARLRADCALEEVVAAYRNRRGSYTSYLGRYTVVLFPYVEGVSAWERPLTDEQVERAAAMMARLHASLRCFAGPMPLRATFANPFAAPIERVLEGCRRPVPLGKWQQRVRELVLAEERAIRAGLERMRWMEEQLRALDLDWVMTHGDPNRANIIVAPDGGLHLIDWGEIAIGPRERDLFAFTGDHFRRFLRRYLDCDPAARLHVPVFAFYEWRWTMQEIADYTTRILFGNGSPAEQEYWWGELRPYLPIPESAMAARVEEIRQVIAAVERYDPSGERR